MCAIYGFLDYGKKIPYRLLIDIIREFSIAAECRGTDATGISYVKNGEIVTFKKAKPAHKLNLFFPKGTSAVIGHNRMTTQGSEQKNCNNHPFEGRTEKHTFALAHNGVLYNDKEIRKVQHLPETVVETDSYIAVQLLERLNSVENEVLKNVAETVDGSFVFTVLRNDNTLFLVKGDNPITLYHFPEYGLYIYASTTEILDRALRSVKFQSLPEEVIVRTGDIIRIDSNGNLSASSFRCKEYSFWRNWLRTEPDESDAREELFDICGFYGIDREEIDLLLDTGYTSDEIDDMLLDEDFLEAALAEAKALYEC